MYCNMPPNWKLFSLDKLHEIEPLKIHMEATTIGGVDQLWTKEECYSHSQHILGKVKIVARAVATREPVGLHCYMF